MVFYSLPGYETTEVPVVITSKRASGIAKLFSDKSNHSPNPVFAKMVPLALSSGN